MKTINQYINESKINIEENLDMYFQLIDYKSLSEQHNLYLCKMKDNNDIYERFILKSSRILEKNNIIHIIKIKITISGQKKNINCLRYENLSINEYINEKLEKFELNECQAYEFYQIIGDEDKNTIKSIIDSKENAQKIQNIEEPEKIDIIPVNDDDFDDI